MKNREVLVAGPSLASHGMRAAHAGSLKQKLRNFQVLHCDYLPS